MRPPSGEQFELVHGEQRAVVVEVGGALRAYEVGDVPRLDGYAEDERCTGARGQTLVPWPNRLRDGSYEFGGESHQLPLTEPGSDNAIHGLVRWMPFRAAERSPSRVVMQQVLPPQSGWPGHLDVRIAYELGDEGLTVTTTATNVGRDACPYGTGAHPYLTLGDGKVDDWTLRAPGRRRLPTDDRGIPEGEEPVDGTEHDFRTPRPIGDTQLDTPFADLQRDADGRAWVELTRPGDGARSALWLGPEYRWLMLFTGDSLPREDKRRSGLGVEPMTCPPNALRTGEGVVVLEPGESSSASWGLAA